MKGVQQIRILRGDLVLKNTAVAMSIIALSLGFIPATQATAQTFPVLAIGILDQSRAGTFVDVSGLTYNLENGVRANELGGFGSAIAYASGSTFLALPDRGPNAVEFDDAIDNTASYVDRFHTIQMKLQPNTSGSGYPFTLTPELQQTTLLWSLTHLVYGSGDGLGVGSGRPPINNFLQHFLTGRSDNFDPARNSGDPADARLDTEGMRLSNDLRSVFISDEYGPYVYQLDRLTGVRLCSFRLPESFFVTNLSPVGNTEIIGNTIGRTANKGMEGLAITPDGRTLVGIMQNALIQDANDGGPAANLLRIVTMNIASGRTTHQFAYLLTTGTGVSEILALNDHELLVDERDGKGRGNANNAKVKQLFKIDLNGAVDVSDMDGSTAAAHAVAKTPFLDIVQSLTKAGIAAGEIPAKIEGVAFGPDVQQGSTSYHTLWIANDNDFLEMVPDASGNMIPNPNQFFVFGFTDADLGGSAFVPQQFSKQPW
jgi:hypothetical protein